MVARGEKTRLPPRSSELERRLARAEKKAEALLEVGRALGADLDPVELLPLVLGKVRTILEAKEARLYLVDEERRVLVPHLVDAELDLPLPELEIHLGRGLIGLAGRGRRVCVADVRKDERFRPELDAGAYSESGRKVPKSLLAVPIVSHDAGVLGVIALVDKVRPRGSRGRRAFSKEDEELLASMAPQVALAIDHASLLDFARTQNDLLRETKEQLEHRVSDLKLLFELETAMSSAKTFEELASAVTRAAGPACGAERGVLLVDEEEAGLWLYATEAKPPRGRGSPEVRRVRCQRGEGLLGWVMAKRQAVSLPARGDEEIPVSQRLSELLGFQVRSAIAAPLEGGEGEPLGALALYNSSRPEGFSEEDRSLLRLVAANVTTAVRLARERFEHERGERLSSIGRLLSSVLHDLRTPLTVISGYAQLMARSEDRSTREQHLQVVLRQFDLLSSMQREVLEFARGERTSLIRKVHLVPFFTGLEQQLREEVKGSQVELSLELLDRGSARFDEAKLTRALHNLARNALEAIGAREGFLRLRVERAADGALLCSVEDSGGGIPEALRPYLFQPFATSGKRGGTGLGLAVVKKIVDDHGGSIELSPTPLGSRFTLRLPQGESPPSRASVVPVQASASTPHRVATRPTSNSKSRASRREEPTSDGRVDVQAPLTVRAGSPSR